MRSEVSKMETEILMRREYERIQDLNVLSSLASRLGLSKTKVIPTEQSHLL